MQYRTKAGDMLDAICAEYYESAVGAVEAVLDANQFLSRKEPLLEEGLIIELPELPQQENQSTINLWD